MHVNALKVFLPLGHSKQQNSEFEGLRNLCRVLSRRGNLPMEFKVKTTFFDRESNQRWPYTRKQSTQMHLSRKYFTQLLWWFSFYAMVALKCFQEHCELFFSLLSSWQLQSWCASEQQPCILVMVSAYACTSIIKHQYKYTFCHHFTGEGDGTSYHLDTKNLLELHVLHS